MTKPKRYLMLYDFEVENKPGGYVKEEIIASGKGACDAFVFASILRLNETGEPHEGEKSIQFHSRDGRNDGPVPDTELFQIFGHLAHMIATEGTNPKWQRDICANAFEAIRFVLTAKSGPCDHGGATE